MEDLSEDLIVNIFHRLPVKTLGFCMCVNKEWHSLIKSPSFVSSNSKYNDKNDQELIINTSNVRQLQLYVDNDKLDRYKILTIPFKVYDDCWPLAICNGVLCLATDCFNIILWNPIIRKKFTIPKPNFIPRSANRERLLLPNFIPRSANRERLLLPNFIPRSANRERLLLGFAFDSFSNNYKILKIILSRYKSIQVEIFSLDNNSWKDISEIAQRYDYDIWGYSLVVFNGAMHCICSLWNDITISKNYAISVFDVNKEIFREIALPHLFNQMENLELEVYKESYIALCCEYNQESLEIWVMKDYGNVESWENIWKCGNLVFPLLGMLNFPKVLGFRNNGKVWCRRLSAESSSRRIISIDLGDNTVQVSELECDILNHYLPCQCVQRFRYFEESLFLLDNVNATNYSTTGEE